MTIFEHYVNIFGIEIRFRIVIPEWMISKKTKEKIGFKTKD